MGYVSDKLELKGMVGSQALVAFQRSDGTMAVYSSPIKSYDTHLEQGNLSFLVYTLSAVYENDFFVIFATLGIPNNVTTVNQLWQQGPLHGNTPGMHSMSGPNLKSYGTLDFLSGKVVATGTHHSSVSTMKIAHGIMNTISWGILMPIGAIVAWNFKGFGPAWFYVHVSCQVLGSLGGIAGSVTGLMLGHKSSGIEYKGHKCIGITLMSLATVQVLARFLLWPKTGSQV
ncbi:putative cytochrome b561 and DOMON domain-containing protein [Rosa chinensis]|uniref:Putative cytochrome b561 and DOMON domain-containing protein n=1 Tax=Rosa chinensis TaxID=74649 RepID=A0A2P6S219_ROSCH|nr:putative cytochrome b561 and DOMON domain-containing protein [Rosa chinensis]